MANSRKQDENLSKPARTTTNDQHRKQSKVEILIAFYCFSKIYHHHNGGGKNNRWEGKRLIFGRSTRAKKRNQIIILTLDFQVFLSLFHSLVFHLSVAMEKRKEDDCFPVSWQSQEIFARIRIWVCNLLSDTIFYPLKIFINNNWN